MNICFFTTNSVSPTVGGTERITLTVAKSLRDNYGWRCFSLYGVDAPIDYETDVFEDAAKIEDFKKDKDVLREKLAQWKIDLLINQGGFSLSGVFSEVLHEIGAKYVFCHHFEPGWELNFLKLKYLVERFQSHRSIANLIRVMLYPYYEVRQRIEKPKGYRVSYEKADAVVLLSKGFIPQFMKFGGIGDRSKFRVIHNGLSFDSFFDANKLGEKKKEVLIVSRMTDTPKKISYALRIWNEVEKTGRFPDWTLRLVGDGSDLGRYQRYVAKQRLQQVVFEGAHAPEESYRRAALFMMTSRSEGWGLTLTEAQQNGCVPLAFDTYASLHEIITDGYDGLIIPKDDLGKYAEKLMTLMGDDKLREKLAAQAIESSHRFEQKAIARQWHELLLELKTK